MNDQETSRSNPPMAQRRSLLGALLPAIVTIVLLAAMLTIGGGIVGMIMMKM
jgi:hypothetical protein